MKKTFLKNYFNKLKYDLSEKSFYSHAIDQKLLPDVISLIGTLPGFISPSDVNDLPIILPV